MHLPTYLSDMHFDIKVFNEHAKDLYQQKFGQYQEDVSETLFSCCCLLHMISSQTKNFNILFVRNNMNMIRILWW